jgi:hypothetical protein
MNTPIAHLVRSTLAFFLVVASALADDPARSSGPRREALERPEGVRIAGTLVGDPKAGFRFVPEHGKAMPLAVGSVIDFEGPDLDPSAAIPPFRVELGLGRRISGRLGAIDGEHVRLVGGPSGAPVTVARPGVQAVLQRTGEVQAISDGFETLAGARWSLIGDPEIVADPRVEKAHSLRIPAGGASLTCRISEPIGAGRLEVAFHDSGEVVANQQWFVDLLFRGPTGPETVRAVLGWAEESLAVETPGGPGLAVQRLARKRGWHRLTVRFGPDQTELGVDGNNLAHGKGPGGPLVEVRLASYATENVDPPDDLAGHFDDLHVIRFSEPSRGLEVDPSQDEARLTGGDQVYGTVRTADEDRVVFRVGGREVDLPWSDISGLYFRRAPAQGEPVEGLLVRLEWRSAPGRDPRDLDQAEGALVVLNDSALTLATPYAGTLTIPRDRLRTLRVVGLGRRLVIDPTAHHLGNDIVSQPPALDPPLPEGRLLERTFELTSVPPGAAFVVADVEQVEGEGPGFRFANKIREGELRTTVHVNGKAIDYLNRLITTKNETPERVRMPIPAGLLKPGRNVLRFEQAGIANDPNYLDDLGVLEIALEFDADPARAAAAGPFE